MPKRKHFNVQFYEKGGSYYHDEEKGYWFFLYNTPTREFGKRGQKRLKAKTKNLLLSKIADYFNGQEEKKKPKTTTISMLIEQWFKNNIMDNVAANTLANYHHYATFITDKFGSSDINSLTINDVESFLNDLSVNGGQNQKGLAASSVNATRKLLHSVYVYAQQHKLTTIDPTVGIRAKKDLHKADQQDSLCILTEEEMLHFLDVAKKGDYIYSGVEDQRELVVNDSINFNIKTAYLLVLLGFSTGLRFGELRGLRRDSIDLEHNKINVTHQLLRYDAVGKMPTKAELEALYNKAKKSGRITDRKAADKANPFQPLKTVNSKRTIDIDDNLKAAITEYLAYQDEYASTHPTYNNEWGLLFTTGIGTTINEQNFRTRYFNKMLIHSGIQKDLTLHKMRHTHASILLNKGIDIAIISRRLGHANPSITYNVYVHVMPQASVEASNAWGQIFKDKEQEPSA